MFKNTFQSGFLSILYSIGSKPLQLWDKAVANGHITRITDEDIQSSVLELTSANVATTYITCPADPAATLGVKLPFLVMVVGTTLFGNKRSTLVCRTHEQHRLVLPVLSCCGAEINTHVYLATPLFETPEGQEPEAVLQLRGDDFGRQECAAALQGIKLSVGDPRQALHLHHADEA
jgi:Protein of unknown function (DUF667)